MIDRRGRMDAEVVGCVITGMSDLNMDESSSEGSSMPGLQDRARGDSSSSDDTIPMVRMICMKMENLGDVRNKP